MPNEKNLPQKITSVQPLDVQFAKIGSTDDNGQAALILPRLKTLIEGRKDCTISVAGYADTLGSDKLNLKISQERARRTSRRRSNPPCLARRSTWRPGASGGCRRGRPMPRLMSTTAGSTFR